MDPAYKSLALEHAQIKASGDHQFTGYVARFGNVDAGGDVILPGAFDTTLKERKSRPLLWQHDTYTPIGKELSLKADDNGLLGTWQISDTQAGRDAYTLLKDGAISGMSIGYVPTDVEYAGDVRKLKTIDLLESSVVTLPMNEAATIQSVKAQWDTAYVNNLPDSAFALILPGGEKDSEGKTTPRDLRKLPHHDMGGSVDMPHLRNALSRCPQMDCTDAQKSKAEAHLQAHMDAMDKGLTLPPHTHGDLFDGPLADAGKHITEELVRFVEEAKALHDRRRDDGRELADAHVAAITALLDQAEAVLGLKSLLPKERASGDAELDRIRLTIALHRLARMGAGAPIA